MGLASTILGMTGMMPCIYAQHFDEPTVMNQPYTQEVQDPYFGDYEGTYAPADLKPDAGGPQPVKAEAKVFPQGNRGYRVVLRAQPPDSTEWPLQVELDGRLEGESIRVAGFAGGHEWEGEAVSYTHLTLPTKRIV